MFSYDEICTCVGPNWWSGLPTQALQISLCSVSGSSFSLHTGLIVLTQASKTSDANETRETYWLFLRVSGLPFAANVVTTPKRKARHTYGCLFTQDWIITGQSHSKVCPFMLPGQTVRAVCLHLWADTGHLILLSCATCYFCSVWETWST